jgi:hypothetical protein
MTRFYRYHIVTAFSRPANFEPMYRMLEPMDVTWHLLVEETARLCLQSPAPWVKLEFYPAATDGFHPAHYLGNCFLQSGLNPVERYQWLPDDTFLPEGFHVLIDRHPGEVVICTLDRGPHHPNECAVNPRILNACPEKIARGYIAGEQMIFSGKVGKAHRFGSSYSGDFDFIQSVTNDCAPNFAPEAKVKYNFLERGRWDKVGL